MKFPEPPLGKFFAVQRGDDCRVLTWVELTCDWIIAGYEVVSWTYAASRDHTAKLMRMP